MRSLLIFLVLFLPGYSTHALACGDSSICLIAGERHYHIRLPAGHNGKTKVGAIFFAHGLGGRSSGIIQNRNLTRMANRLGVALVALQSKNSDWNIKNSPAGRSDRSSNEYAYLDNVIKDIGTSAHSNVKEVIAAYAKIGKYKKTNSSKATSLNCTNRRNFRGKILDFCLHGGGHRFRAQDIEYAWRKFRSLGVL